MQIYVPKTMIGRITRLALLGLGLGVVILPATGYAVHLGKNDQHKVLVSDKGITLPTPDIETLGCRDMGALLKKYANSQYRGPEPVPENDPNYALFEYENQLAASYYSRCNTAPEKQAPPSDAFSEGFD